MTRFLIFFVTMLFALAPSGLAMRIFPTLEMPPKIGIALERKLARVTGLIENSELNVEGGWRYKGLLGTLISRQWLLTCGHSAEFMKGGTATIDGKQYAIEKVLIYPNFAGDGKQNDFALVKLADGVDGDLDFPKMQSQVDFLGDGTFFNTGLDRTDAIFSDSSGKANAVGTKTVVGEISFLGNKMAPDHLADEIAARGYGGMTLTFHSDVPSYSFANFIGEPGDSGGGLFDSRGRLLGVLASIVSPVKVSYILYRDYSGPVTMDVNFYSVIDREAYKWIERTIAEHSETLPPSISESVDPSQGENVRALLANPLVPAADAQVIAELLRDNMRYLDGSCRNSI